MVKFILCLFFLVGNVFAQEKALVETEKQEAIVRHNVTLGNSELFEVKEKLGSFTAQQRAEIFSERIKKLSSNRSIDIEMIKTESTNDGVDIVYGDQIIMTVSTLDAQHEGVAVERLAQSRLEIIRAAILKDREAKSLKSLSINAGIAGLITIILFVLLFVIKKVFHFAFEKIKKSKGLLIRSIKIKNTEILNEDRITNGVLFLARALRLFLTLFLLYFYFPLVLGLFPWTERWAEKLYGYILDPIYSIWNLFVGFIPNIFFIAIICIITNYILNLVKLIFDEIERGVLHFSGFHQEWAAPTYKLVRIFIFAFAFIVIFPYLPGSGSAAFQGVSVFLGILISLGSSSAIGNMVAGIVITYMRPFRVGDRVKIASTMGDVVEKTLLVTRIKTIKNEDITIPNSIVLSSHIINYNSSGDQSDQDLILNTSVTIGYDVEWRKVHELLIKAALNTPNIIKEKKPFVLQTALNDFSVNYEINAFTDDPQQMANTYSFLHQNIQDSFHSAGVEIMSPNFIAIRDGGRAAIPQNPNPSDKDNGV